MIGFKCLGIWSQDEKYNRGCNRKKINFFLKEKLP